MTSEAKRIQDQLRRAFQGPAWHGQSLKELLAGIQPGEAAAKPIPGAHSIWEIVLHITAWNVAVWRRLQGDPAELAPEEDWPPVGDTGDLSWREALSLLEVAHKRLWDELDEFEDDRLKEDVPGNSYSVYFMLHGLIQHNLYHAGQVALLKKH